MSARDSETFLLAATIDHVEVGQSLSTAPHMTVLQWFHETQYPDFFDRRLDGIFGTPNALGKWVGKSHLRFGKRFEIPVREMVKLEAGTTPQNHLHLTTKALMLSLGGEFYDAWHKDKYAPHITDSPIRKIQDGEVVTFSTATLFRRTPEGDIADTVYPLVNTEQS